MQLGMLMFIVANVVGSTIQITTLPLPVLSTLQASGLVFNSICASIILNEPFTRYSFIGTDPFATLTIRGGRASWTGRPPAGLSDGPGWWPPGRSWRSCRNSFALGVGSERQEHVFEPGALGGPELGEGDARCQGHGPDPSGVGVRADRAVPGERAGDPGPLEGVREVAR